MTRHIAGVFDRRGFDASRRLAGALACADTTLLELGPLHLVCSGPRPAEQEPRCLLGGFVDNADELARELALPEPGVDLPARERVLAAGYRRWGRDLVARLRGDFVLMIWDDERQEGVLARDQLGVRCAYLHGDDGALSFATELGELLALLPARPQPDRAGVAHWLAMSNRPGPHTLFAGIHRLDPGSMLLLDRHGARAHAYWAPRFVEPQPLPAAQLAERVQAALERAVARRVDPGARTGVLMSGGLDSAAVAAVAAGLAPGAISAYAGVFPEHPAVDESSLIAELRERLALSGATAHVRAGGLLAGVLDAVTEWSAPPAAWGDFWTLPLLRVAASDGVLVALGGDGGDELFAARGYLLADDVRRGRLRAAHAHSLELPGAGERPSRRQVARVLARFGLAGAAPYRLHDALSRPFATRRLPPWLRRGAARAVAQTDDPLAWKRLDGPRWWAHAAHGLTRGVEEAGVFEHHRRRAALAGLHSRHPLFDLDLVELVLAAQPESSLDPRRNRPLLRGSMAGRLPDSVRLRPAKAWFDSLIVDCLMGDGVAVRRILTEPGAELGAYVDQRAMRRALFDAGSRAPAPGFAWMHQVWRLLTAECWLRCEAAGGARPDLPVGLTTTTTAIDVERAPERPRLRV